MPAGSTIYTVKELNEKIQELVSGEPWLGSLGVMGEITGLGRDKRGHMYFSLKDASGVLSAVMFAGKQIYGLGFAPENGDKVHAFGHVDVYVRDGKYQLYVDRLVRVGDGEVNAALEKLRARLDVMGLFSQEYKKPIPRYPRRIGIVTAGDKAAISDIKAVAARRDPYAQLYCYPATVQGQYAAADISRGIEILDEMGLDLIIVGRGGGSKEDLWAFNEEQVAWAIFNAETPIISAAGHEIDTTIADMVADRRESNPSTAVMHALPVVSDTVMEFDNVYQHISSVMESRLERCVLTLESHARQIALLSPETRMSGQRDRLAGYERRIAAASPAGKVVVMNQMLDMAADDLDELMRKLMCSASDRLDRYAEGVSRGMKSRYDDTVHRLEVVTEKIHGLSPTAKLVNGFGYITRKREPVRSVTCVSSGDELELTVHDGVIAAVVSSTDKLEV